MDQRFKNIHFQEALACSRAIQCELLPITQIETLSDSEQNHYKDKTEEKDIYGVIVIN